jgi:hypothetical protein
VGKLETIVSIKPPAPTKPAIVAYRKTLEIECDTLRASAAPLAFASAKGDSSAREALAAIPGRLAALQFEINLNHECQQLSEQEDSDAEIAWQASLQSMDPEDLIAGINKDECCHRCQPGIAGGCVLSGGTAHAGSTCWHPTRMGTFHQFSTDNSGLRVFPFRDNPRAAKVFNAACDKLKVRGKFA